jgi:GDPmannose 4,6-dehydratase
MHASNGILFNHEGRAAGRPLSPARSRVPSPAILAGKGRKLHLGNLDAKRDWGYAKNLVEAMWMMLQQDHPDDYVVATGCTRSVRDFLDERSRQLGTGWHDFVEIAPRYFRPAEVDLLIGDSTKARQKLGSGAPASGSWCASCCGRICRSRVWRRGSPYEFQLQECLRGRGFSSGDA